MKRGISISASFLILFLSVLTSCIQSSAYEQGNLLEYFVAYEEGSFGFPKVPWGSSVDETAEKLHVDREDMEDAGNEQYRLKKRISFTNPTCSGYLICSFQDDALVSVRLSLSNSLGIQEEAEYPEIDLKGALSALASELENSNFPEPMTAGGLEPLRKEISQGITVRWENEDHSRFEISTIGNDRSEEVVSLYVGAPLKNP